MDDEILATVDASPVRRWIGVLMLAGLGALVIYVALATPPALGWQVFLIALGAVALWVADKMRKATEFRIELTRDVLRDSSGRQIAQVKDVVSIDRGFLAFKPSNGFLIRTATPEPRAWRPGLWWRAGHRVGIGGVTPGGQARAMADILAAMVAMRDQDAHAN